MGKIIDGQNLGFDTYKEINKAIRFAEYRTLDKAKTNFETLPRRRGVDFRIRIWVNIIRWVQRIIILNGIRV